MLRSDMFVDRGVNTPTSQFDLLSSIAMKQAARSASFSIARWVKRAGLVRDVQALLQQGGELLFAQPLAPMRERRSGGGSAAAQPAVDVKSLHAKIGELTLENDLYERSFVKALYFMQPPWHGR